MEDEKGTIVDKTSIKYGLVGALLMDLALVNKIDTDLENLMIVDTSPTGDDILDDVLTQIAQSKRSFSLLVFFIIPPSPVAAECTAATAIRFWHTKSLEK